MSRSTFKFSSLTKPFSKVQKVLSCAISLRRRVHRDDDQSDPKELSQVSSFKDATDAEPRRRVAPIRRAGLGGVVVQEQQPVARGGLDLTALTRLVMRRNSRVFAAGEANPLKLAFLRRASGGTEDCCSQAASIPPAAFANPPDPATHGASYAKARFRQQAAAYGIANEADGEAS
jgi:hypothetical protein